MDRPSSAKKSKAIRSGKGLQGSGTDKSGLSGLTAANKAGFKEVLVLSNKAHLFPGKRYFCQPASCGT